VSRKYKILSHEELMSRIEASRILIENTQKTRDNGFVKKALSMLLFREHGIENYQPLYISESCKEILGSKNFSLLVNKLKSPRSRIFPTVAQSIRSLGFDYKRFTLEHVVDVNTMTNFLMQSDLSDLKSNVIILGRKSPMCIVTSEEDAKLQVFGRNNIEDPWDHYFKVGIKPIIIRGFCGPLKEGLKDCV